MAGVSERRVCAGARRGARGGCTGDRPSAGRRRSVGSSVDRRSCARSIQQHPTFGYRRLWALLRFHEGLHVNRKAVYRVLKQKRWLVHQRPCTPRPRVRGWVSRASRSNERWAMDVTHIACGRDGWAHLAAVIDCHDRELIGYEFALAGSGEGGRAGARGGVPRALRDAAARGPDPMLRSDNGLIFQSRRFRQACRDYRLRQEFITPYTPEQNGIIERFFRSLKEECVWQHQFRSFAEARPACGSGSSGTTTGGRIRRSAIAARANIGHGRSRRSGEPTAEDPREKFDAHSDPRNDDRRSTHPQARGEIGLTSIRGGLISGEHYKRAVVPPTFRP